MKVVVAVDSFKGSMTSMVSRNRLSKQVFLQQKRNAEVIVKPLADGGEGTTDALIEGLKGERVDVTVTGPYHEPVQAYYGYLRESNTAVMEMATAAGITLSDKKEPMTATTYGVGELILHAIGRGIRNFIIGIGGSATNDGGVGMLKALGYRFLDEKGELKRKADIFSKRTIRRAEPVTSVDTASEALAVSISEKACVDMDYMSQLNRKNKRSTGRRTARRDLPCAGTAGTGRHTPLCDC